jgi:fructosamine-3-kinase
MTSQQHLRPKANMAALPAYSNATATVQSSEQPSTELQESQTARLETMTIKQILAHLGGVFHMDEALVAGSLTRCYTRSPQLIVVTALPQGRNFVSVEHFRTSAWTITGKVTALGPDKSEEYYFVKIAYGDTGRIMLGGEYESSKIIHDTMPDFIPQPIGFGRYRAPGPKTYFYLAEFVDMDVTTAPDPAEFTSRLAQLHKLSKSPTGKFGFAVPTCDGDRAHVVDWQESWAVFYRNLFLGVCELDLKRNGPWPEYERAIEQVASKVIPRLLEPLQANGRELKPCIIHGDLWEGNMGINMETGDSILFDAGSYFAHNEMELGHW